MELNTYELLYMARCNEPRAYVLLKKKFSPIVMRAFQKLRKQMPTLDYDEIEQVMTIGIYNAVAHYRSDKDMAFSSFVILCMQREALNYVRRYGKEYIAQDGYILSLDSPCCNDDDETALYDIVPDHSNEDPLSTVNAELLRKRIDQQLSERERLILDDRIAGYANPEICQRHQLTYKQVDNAIQNIRKKAKNCLKEVK